MDIEIIEKNLDYISINYQFSQKGSDQIKKYIKDEIVSQVILDTTLNFNQWSAIPNKKNMFRSTGGMTLLVSSNKFIIQVSGEAFLFLKQSQIQNILIKAKQSIQKNRKFDIEKELRIDDLSISVGRLDSQLTIAIKEKEINDFFNLDINSINGKERIFTSYVNGKSVITGKSWIKHKDKCFYDLSVDDLKLEPQPILKKRDFLRIYDKLLEVIETTLPHSEKRIQLVKKYSKHIKSGFRIFRIEIQENDRRLTTELDSILDFNPNSFKDICNKRLNAFAKRNPFKMWDHLLIDEPASQSQGWEARHQQDGADRFDISSDVG